METQNKLKNNDIEDELHKKTETLKLLQKAYQDLKTSYTAVTAEQINLKLNKNASDLSLEPTPYFKSAQQDGPSISEQELTKENQFLKFRLQMQ